jgi:glucose/mannose-6-phosphate isomerase
MIDRKSLNRFDKQDMYSVLFDFPLQICNAVDIANKVKVNKIKTKGVNNVIINGLGGSAIGGDLMRSYVADEMTVPVYINRNYTLPAFAKKDTLAII